MDSESDSFQSDDDSEIELQSALASGILQPGLNIEEPLEQKTYINNEVALNSTLNEFLLNLPWVERLDLDSEPAPVAPELAAKLQEEKENVTKGKIDSLALNDFEREMTFHRQAQAAAVEGITRLKELGILTKRPDDYFAQMAKTDSQMQKIREALQKKQEIQARVEKVRQIRQMRKINKELQKQARVKQMSEKKEFLDQVKKYREKVIDNLDFLETKPKPKPKVDLSKVKKPMNRRAQRKKNVKELKFGFGGKKKGGKRNSLMSLDGVKSKTSKGGKNMKFGGPKGGNRRPGNMNSPGGKNIKSGGRKGANARPGKAKRMQNKSRKGNKR